MPQFQLAVPQLYNERAMCVRLSPAGSRGRRNRAPPSRCRVPGASEGLPGEAAVRCAGLLSAHTRLLRMPPWIRTAEEQEGGSTPRWHFCEVPIRQHRTAEQGGGTRGSVGSTASGRQGRSSHTSSAGRRESRLPAPRGRGMKQESKQNAARKP